MRNIAWLVVSLLPLMRLVLLPLAKTGFIFGNPEYLRYNAEATSRPSASSWRSCIASFISPRT